MQQKTQLRKKYLNLRKNKYFNIDKSFFLPLVNLIRNKFKKKIIKVALYYPSNFELNVLKILDHRNFSNQEILLPVTDKNNLMNFFSWKKNEVLYVGKFGILEPIKSKPKIPDLILVPILAFDKNKYRLGYGKGFYDRYLNKYLKKFKNIFTVGIAFSFQRHDNLPVNQKDVKLDYIITEKGIF
ncbi:5-formyltetrahydrofolate cyclo-ligase [Candidatus Pelagibacter communis]|uniref:5-formyltetrahydrofolate cyclo-ligase n=1 Tax=Pelagibacter ubique TaxID=198252 RepID=UPI00094CD1DF|nr:5-formyltetrahydrofolate cyclo-ligase [Candidatus Pelagibacter ubique]